MDTLPQSEDEHPLPLFFERLGAKTLLVYAGTVGVASVSLPNGSGRKTGDMIHYIRATATRGWKVAVSQLDV